jgi:DNA-binding PadR family transcriptional regulator
MDASMVDRAPSRTRRPPDPAALLPLTPAIFHILLVLADGRAHGYAIMQEIERFTRGAVTLGPGTLYRSLQRMAAEGLIQEYKIHADSDEDDERRRYFRLTRFGRDVARKEAERLATLVAAARCSGLLTRTARRPAETPPEHARGPSRSRRTGAA